MLTDLPHSEIVAAYDLSKSKRSNIGYLLRSEHLQACHHAEDLDRDGKAIPSLAKNDLAEFIRLSFLNNEYIQLISEIYVDEIFSGMEVAISREEAADLVQKALGTETFVRKLIPAFEDMFTREELSQLVQIFNMDVYKKFQEYSGSSDFGALLFSAGEDVAVLALQPYFLSGKTDLINAGEARITTVTGVNFSQEVLTSDRPVVLGVYNSSHDINHVLARIFAELDKEFDGKIKFAMLDIENEEAFAQELDLEEVPAFLFYKGGKVVDRYDGPIDDIEEFIITLARAFL